LPIATNYHLFKKEHLFFSLKFVAKFFELYAARPIVYAHSYNNIIMFWYKPFATIAKAGGAALQ